MINVHFSFEMNSRKLYTYIHNYLLYLLIDTNESSDILLRCLTGSLFFFAVENNYQCIEIIAKTIKIEFLSAPKCLKDFINIYNNVAENLKYLGNDPHLVDKIISRLDIRNFFN